MPARYIYFDNENYFNLSKEENMSQLVNNLLSEYYKNLKPQLNNLDLINSQSDIIRKELEELEKKKELLKEIEEKAKLTQEEKDKAEQERKELERLKLERKKQIRLKYETETPKDKQGMSDFENYLTQNGYSE